VAAAIAADRGIAPRAVDVSAVQAALRAQGAFLQVASKARRTA
jgi:hypothetical protein